MKKIFLPVFVVFVCLAANGQEQKPFVAIKWAPTGLIPGNISLLGEYSFSKKSSLTAKIGIPVNRYYQAIYDNNDADVDMKALSFLAGYRTYLSKNRLKGFYMEPFFKYVHHSSEGVGEGELDGEPVVMSFTNDYNGAGIGVQLGVQFLIKDQFVIDLFFLGPEINLAKNNFRAVEISNSDAWSSIEAQEAEEDIREFLDDLPFIRNNMDIMVDPETRTVAADFNGPLPGIRAGFSIGIAF